jgi:hypothetical protein
MRHSLCVTPLVSSILAFQDAENSTLTLMDFSYFDRYERNAEVTVSETEKVALIDVSNHKITTYLARLPHLKQGSTKEIITLAAVPDHGSPINITPC